MDKRYAYDRIVLCGASSVGKTTIGEDWCRKHPDFHHMQEVARDLMRERAITREHLKESLESDDKTFFLDFEHLIFVEQNTQELSLPRGCPFISDRGPDPLAFVQFHIGRKAAEKLALTPEAQACLQRYRQPNYLIVVVSPLDQPTDDGFRMVLPREEQIEFTHIQRQILREHQVPHVYMSMTNRKERIHFLDQLVDGEIPFKVAFNFQGKCQPQETLRMVKVTTVAFSTALRPVFSPGTRNRMVDRYGNEHFVLLDFDAKVSADVVIKVLRQGLVVDGREYQFVGCSSGGLKKRTCYMFEGSVDDIEKVWQECGAFSSIKSVSKRLKRIALLFSEAMSINITVPDEQVIQEKDVETSVGNFTDGCGAVSTELATRIVQGLGLSEQEYSPSVFQIRYQGCKGVVIRDPLLTEHSLMVRDSMKKFRPGTKPFLELWLCDHSRPYSYGHLNKQFIMLLSGLGVDSEVLLLKQAEHLNRLERMKDDPETAVQMLHWNNQPDLAAKLARCLNLEQYRQDCILQREVRKLHSKLIQKLEKLSLLVPESRTLFGVCDPRGVLKYGQCFLRPTVRGKPMTLRGRVLVAKNPCYLLGDIRVLEAVDVSKQLDHLVDCLVFPVTGKRPHSAEIAGSDLDGDQYFVCWDVSLIPPTVKSPYDYPSIEAPSCDRVTRDMMIDYIARSNKQSMMMGKINSAFQYWADTEGVESYQCRQLGELFSRSVDASKTGDVVKIPKSLEIPKEVPQILPTPRVWKEMEERAKRKKAELMQEVVHTCLSTDEKVGHTIEEKFVWSLVKEENLSMSEFKVFEFVLRWCSSQSFSEEEMLRKVREFAECINFGKFTVDEQLAAIDAGIERKVVTNALNKSQLLSPKMLEPFSLQDASQSWCFYFRSGVANFQWQDLLRALNQFNESMLVFKLRDQVTFILHFLSTLQLGETELDFGTAVAYFYSAHFDYHFRHVLGPSYSLLLNQERLQLYRGKNQAATFICFIDEISGKMSSDDSLFDRISVDLTKFKHNILQGDKPHPKVNKQELQFIEVFVKNTSSDSTYFDVYEPYQIFDGHLLEEKEEEEEFEELPNEEEIEGDPAKKPEIETYSLDTVILVLHSTAEKGCCISFQNLLGKILCEEKSTPDSVVLRGALLSLLGTMVMRYTHKSLPTDILDSLQVIITSLQHYIRSFQHWLLVLEKVSRLHCTSLIEVVAALAAKNASISGFSEVLSIESCWELWFYLPYKTACDLASLLHAKSHTLLDSEAAKQECTPLKLTSDSQNILQKLASERDPCLAAPKLQVQQYVCYFSHHLLRNLLDEVASMREQQLQEQGQILTRMRAYDFKDPHHLSSGLCDIDDDQHTIKNARNETVTMGFLGSQRFASRVFSIGTVVAISLMIKKGCTVAASSPVTLGRIVRASFPPMDIVVSLVGPAPRSLTRSALLGKGLWQLQSVGNITAFSRATKALKRMLEQPPEVAHILVHPAGFYSSGEMDDKQPKPAPAVVIQPLSLDSTTGNADDMLFQETAHFPASFPLNASQRCAISAALGQRLTLIHGPPGTGKTHVACEIVRRVCDKFQAGSNKCVLVAAETNMAVDNLTRKLCCLGLRVIRVGSLGQVARDIRHTTLEHQVEMKRIDQAKVKSKSPFVDSKSAKRVLSGAQVVAATCAGVGDPVLNGLSFPFVLIDEATQATEPMTLIAVTHQCQQLTLIGDPQQLAPVLHTACKNSSSVNQLTVTLFHRLQRVLPSFFLDEQHRMHPTLAEFPSRMFYQGQLKSAPSLKLRQLILPWQSEGFHVPPLLFIDIASHEQRVGTSWKNNSEADVVVQVVQYLVRNEVSPLEIAVLTPYVGQVRCIQHKLSLAVKNIEVCSVDSFQGREKDVVVFSTVRCNQRGELGFTDDQHRMNVLLTRAKHGMLGIGHQQTLSSSGIWKRWLVTVPIKTPDEFKTMCSPANDSRYDHKKGQDGRREKGAQGRMRSDHCQPRPQQRADKQHDDRQGVHVSHQQPHDTSQGAVTGTPRGTRNRRRKK